MFMRVRVCPIYSRAMETFTVCRIVRMVDDRKIIARV